MTGKQTRHLDAHGHEIDPVDDETRLNLWAATGTLEASDLLAFRRGESDLVALEIRHVAIVDAANAAEAMAAAVIAAEVIDPESAASAVSRTDRWSRFRETA